MPAERAVWTCLIRIKPAQNKRNKIKQCGKRDQLPLGVCGRPVSGDYNDSRSLRESISGSPLTQSDCSTETGLLLPQELYLLHIY